MKKLKNFKFERFVFLCFKRRLSSLLVLLLILWKGSSVFRLETDSEWHTVTCGSLIIHDSNRPRSANSDFCL
jgi:hypothetical protein